MPMLMMFLWRKMNVEILLLVVAFLDLHVNSCPENHFQLPDEICCPFCHKGWYVATNCTRDGGGVIGVTCSNCSDCDNGTEMIAPCTMFSNTVCSKRDLDVIEVQPGTEQSKEPDKVSKQKDELLVVQTALYIIVPAVFIAITAAVVYKRCSRRSVSRDPAEEPLKVSV